MMVDGHVENVQILLSDISESIDYIRRIAKHKPNKQIILSRLRKKDQYKDLVLSYLGEEIDMYLSTGKFYIKSPNSDSLFVSKNVDTPTKFSQNNNDLVYDSDDSQASTNESYNPKNKDRFSELGQRLDMFQNFFS